jgi:multidrug efflux pump subunit AcrB
VPIEQIRSYLSHLKFDPKLLNTLHAKYLVSFRLVILLILIILGVGLTSFFTLPRRLNPEIKLAIVTVSTVLPGAGPADVESLLTIPIENKLLGLNGLDTITSTSQENVSVIVMQFLSGVDKDKARTDAQAAVSSVTTLPQDAQTPQVAALDFENQPVWTFALTTKYDLPTLMRFADTLKTDIEANTLVDHVDLNGNEEQEIEVILDQQKINSLGASPFIIQQTIQKAVNAYPAGNISTSLSTFSLAIDAQAVKIDDLRQLHLLVNGQPVKLGDIAQVQERSKPDQLKTYIGTNNKEGTRGVVFDVYKTSSANIDQTAVAVAKIVNADLSTQDSHYEVTTITNTGEQISKQFSDLVSEFGSTILLVFANLLLFLGLRQAMIASVTIPLTFLAAFGWMAIFGQTINFLTLFAFLLAFGTSIDDTIVMVSAMTTYHRTGKFTAHQTGVLVWKDLIVPIWTTTITTVWAFIPLVLTSGIIGEFIKPLPLVVTMTMYSSTAVAVLITLPLLIVILDPKMPNRVILLGKILGFAISLALIVIISPKSVALVPIILIFIFLLLVTLRIRLILFNKFCQFFSCNKYLSGVFGIVSRIFERGIINTQALGRKYQHLISRILVSKRGRVITLVCVVIFALSAYMLVPLGLVKNEFFPKTDTSTFYVNINLPSGTNLETIDSEAVRMLNELRSTPESIAVVAEPGTQLTSSGNGGANANSILLTIILKPKEQRKQSSIDIAQGIRDKFSQYNKGTLSVIEPSSGPPAGADVQIELLGDDLTVLDTYANKVIGWLKTQPGIINTDKSIKSGTSKVVFVPDKAKMAAAGLTPDTTSFWLRLYASGFKLDTVKFTDKEEDIVFYTSTHDQTPESLGSITIPTPTVTQIPLLSLGEVKLENNPTVINRDSGKRAVTISAGAAQSYNAAELNKKLVDYVQNKLNLAAGYEWKTGGVNEENAKSVNSIFRAMGLSFMLIMITMVVEFNSFRQAGIILALIPLAISGVFYVFALTGTPLSFPALIGVMALFGVVVTNAMFIVEKINQNRKQGMDLNHALTDAAHSRLEPIMLTSITGILGLIPITISNALWRGLGGAIISGLLFSGVIMLFFVPVMYYTVYRSLARLKKI